MQYLWLYCPLLLLCHNQLLIITRPLPIIVKVATRKKAAELRTVIGSGLDYQSVSTAPNGHYILISTDLIPPCTSAGAFPSFRKNSSELLPALMNNILCLVYAFLRWAVAQV